MPQLLAELNGGGTFSRFVRCVRKEFQAVAAAEVQQQQQRQAEEAMPPPAVAAC
jgi:hypothetical protein